MKLEELKKTLESNRDDLITYAEESGNVEEKAMYYEKADNITSKIIEIEKLEESKKNRKIDILSNLAVGIGVPVVLKVFEIAFISHQTKTILHFEETGHMLLSTPGKGLGRIFNFKF